MQDSNSPAGAAGICQFSCITSVMASRPSKISWNVVVAVLYNGKQRGSFHSAHCLRQPGVPSVMSCLTKFMMHPSNWQESQLLYCICQWAQDTHWVRSRQWASLLSEGCEQVKDAVRLCRAGGSAKDGENVSLSFYVTLWKLGTCPGCNCTFDREAPSRFCFRRLHTFLSVLVLIFRPEQC